MGVLPGEGDAGKHVPRAAAEHGSQFYREAGDHACGGARAFPGPDNKMAEEEARYASEKKEIEREAKKAEHERDIYKKRDPYFDFAEALLQISVVMASIAILSASMPAFIFSVVFAVLGAVLSLNGYTMLFHLPFFH